MNPVLALWYAFLSKAYILARTTQLMVMGMGLPDARRKAMMEDQKCGGLHSLTEQRLTEEYEKTYKWLAKQFADRTPSQQELESITGMAEQLNILIASREYESERFLWIASRLKSLAQEIAREPK